MRFLFTPAADRTAQAASATARARDQRGNAWSQSGAVAIGHEDKGGP